MAQYTSLTAALNAVHQAALRIEKDRHVLEQLADTTLANLKRRHGVYGPGWPQLKAATLAEKGANTPRLESGAHSRGSYQTSITNDEASIGTNDPIEEFQELGTFRNGKRAVPPRPIFAPEAQDAGSYAPDIAGQHVAKHLAKL